MSAGPTSASGNVAISEPAREAGMNGTTRDSNRSVSARLTACALMIHRLVFHHRFSLPMHRENAGFEALWRQRLLRATLDGVCGGLDRDGRRLIRAAR